MLTGLRDAGFQFYDWGPPGEQLVRMITAFNTKPEDVDTFLSIASNVASAGKSSDT
jgi:threonine aldolase